MLDSKDKKWIVETIDDKLDTRFEEQEKRIDARFREQNEKLNRVMDERFADAIRSFEQRIDERFDAFEARFMLMMENEIAPMLRIHAEVIPDTYKSYRLLEDRGELLEQNYDILKNAFSSRL